MLRSPEQPTQQRSNGSYNDKASPAEPERSWYEPPGAHGGPRRFLTHHRVRTDAPAGPVSRVPDAHVQAGGRVRRGGRAGDRRQRQLRSRSDER